MCNYLIKKVNTIIKIKHIKQQTNQIDFFENFTILSPRQKKCYLVLIYTYGF